MALSQNDLTGNLGKMHCMQLWFIVSYNKSYYLMMNGEQTLSKYIDNVNAAPTLIFDNVCIMILTHWGRVTHICVDNLTINGSNNGLSPGTRQAIIWTNVGILLIGHLVTNCSEVLIEIW